MQNLNYGVIGNCSTAALISEKGAIEWLCFPEFDSPSVFAAILDRQKGGHFGFKVTSDYKVTQSYVPHTNTFRVGRRSFRRGGFHALLSYLRWKGFLPSGRDLQVHPLGERPSPYEGGLSSGSQLCEGKDHL